MVGPHPDPRLPGGGPVTIPDPRPFLAFAAVLGLWVILQPTLAAVAASASTTSLWPLVAAVAALVAVTHPAKTARLLARVVTA